MDAIVEAALRKWPDVPHCWGWLALDSRGQWFMRDERIQAAGPFPQIKGSRVDHPKLLAFIERNYGHDAQGAWFFQNGPQRVYVQLEAAPWVLRVGDSPGWPVHTHTGLPVAVDGTWLDDTGRLFLATPLGLGLVHTMDMAVAAEAVEAGAWRPQSLPFDALPQRFGFVLRPLPPQG
jgi:hypothetical protein